eukprot:1837757-Pleurochrysis_carterae.AAC.1
MRCGLKLTDSASKADVGTAQRQELSASFRQLIAGVETGSDAANWGARQLSRVLVLCPAHFAPAWSVPLPLSAGCSVAEERARLAVLAEATAARQASSYGRRRLMVAE